MAKCCLFQYNIISMISVTASKQEHRGTKGQRSEMKDKDDCVHVHHVRLYWRNCFYYKCELNLWAKLLSKYYNAEFRSLISYCVNNLESLHGPERCHSGKGNTHTHIHGGVFDWLWPDFVLWLHKQEGEVMEFTHGKNPQSSSFTSGWCLHLLWGDNETFTLRILHERWD